MVKKQNRSRCFIAGAVGCLAIICICIVSAYLFLFVWNRGEPGLSEQVPQSVTIFQPVVAISAQNFGKVKKLYEYSLSATVTSLAWSPDSRLLVWSEKAWNANPTNPANSEMVNVWDVTTGHELHSFEQTGGVKSIAFSPDGRWLAAGAWDGITLWNVTDGNKLQTIDVSHETVGKIAFSPDSETIFAAVGGHQAIHFWEVVSGRPLGQFDGYTNFLLTPEGKILVWSRGQGGSSFTLKLSELETGSDLWTLSKLGEPTALSHDGKIMAWKPQLSEAIVDPLTLLDATNGKELRNFGRFSPYFAVAFSPDDTLIAMPMAGGDFFSPSKVSLWDVQSEKMNELEVGNFADFIAFSPDGRFLAFGGLGYVQLWGIKP